MIYDNSGNGVYCTYYSNPHFQEGYADTGRNVIAYNGEKGIRIDNTSLPYLSQDDPYDPANNSIYSNIEEEVYSEATQEVTATYNWWGEYPPNPIHFVGDVDYSNWLTSDPNSNPHGLYKIIAGDSTANFTNSTNDSPKDAQEHFYKGYKLEAAKKYQEAISEYEYVIDKYPECSDALLALVRLPRCYEKLGKRDEASVYLENVVQKNNTIELGGMATELQVPSFVQQGDYKQALSLYDDIMKNYPQTELAKQALFGTWHIHFDLTKDKEAAKAAMDQYSSIYGEDENLLFMKLAVGEITLENAPKLAKQWLVDDKETEHTSALVPPQKFELEGNYPNPFNPETSIKYALPEAIHVSVEIYNVLGQKIITLLDADMPQGYHVVKWNGRNSTGQKVSAGIYLVRMKAGSFEKTQKMTLLP